jgi:serine/threonine protein kinase
MVSTGHYGFPKRLWKDVSKGAIHLVRKLLEVNTEERYTAKQLLQHPWIKARVKVSEPPENTSPCGPSDFKCIPELRKAINNCVNVKRDGRVLRAATESSIFQRRQQRTQSTIPDLRKDDALFLME